MIATKFMKWPKKGCVFERQKKKKKERKKERNGARIQQLMLLSAPSHLDRPVQWLRIVLADVQPDQALSEERCVVVRYLLTFPPTGSLRL